MIVTPPFCGTFGKVIASGLRDWRPLFEILILSKVIKLQSCKKIKLRKISMLGGCLKIAELGSSTAIVAALLAPLLFLVAVAETRDIFNLSRGCGSALHLSVAEGVIPLPLLDIQKYF